MSSVDKPVIITDEKGKMIGVADSPGSALKNGDVRLVSRVMLKNKEGKYLLQKRSEEMLNWPGYWDHTAAGHVDDGESPEAAAYRELREETGIDDAQIMHIAEYYSAYEQPGRDLPTSKSYNHVYYGKYDIEESAVKFDPGEVSEVKWFTVSEIRKLAQDSLVTDGIMALIARDLL